MPTRLKRSKSRRPQPSSFKARLDIARCSAHHDVRAVREALGASKQEFGFMMGMGLLGELTVERWEIGLEDPPQFVLGWVRVINRFRHNGSLFRVLNVGWRPLTCEADFFRQLIARQGAFGG